MKERTKGVEHSPAEKPSGTTSKRRATDRARSARDDKRPLLDAVALDPVVNEIMIRRIMAALMSPE
jgi:hypothetical protein